MPNDKVGTEAFAVIRDSIGLEWGWLLLIGGALAVIGAGVISGEVAEKIGWDQTDENGLSRFSSRLDQETDDGWAQNIDQKIARHVQEIAQQKPIPRSFGKRLESRTILKELDTPGFRLHGAIAYPIVAMLLATGLFVVRAMPGKAPASAAVQAQAQPEAPPAAPRPQIETRPAYIPDDECQKANRASDRATEEAMASASACTSHIGVIWLGSDAAWNKARERNHAMTPR